MAGRIRGGNRQKRRRAKVPGRAFLSDEDSDLGVESPKEQDSSHEMTMDQAGKVERAEVKECHARKVDQFKGEHCLRHICGIPFSSC